MNILEIVGYGVGGGSFLLAGALVLIDKLRPRKVNLEKALPTIGLIMVIVFSTIVILSILFGVGC